MATLTSSYQYIGRTNAVSCDAGWKYYVLLYAKTVSDVATGEHSVSVKMRLACKDDSSFYGYYTNGSATVSSISAISWSNKKNPSAYWGNSSSLTVGGYTYKRWVDLAEGTAKVKIGYGAAKDISISTSWNRISIDGTRPNWLPFTDVISAKITVTLPMIATASVPTVSASSVTMLDEVTINTNRQSSSFTHDLTYKFNGFEGTIATGVGASYKWTVPDLVSKISGKSSDTCTIYCKTKSGTTVIGTKSVTLTLNIPAKSTPSASASTVQMGTSVDIYTNRKSTAYTHTLTYEMGTASGTIKEGVEGGRTWTPDKSLAEHTGKKTSAICTITCKTYNGTLLVGTATSQIVLTVPSATVPTLSASSIVLGNPITIFTPREVDCYEHDISYTLKAKGSSTVALSKDFNGAVQESYEWTPSITLLAPAIPSATEGTITITCTTRFKDSTTEIGSETASFNITVPNNSTTKPKVNMILTPVHSLASAFSEVYVQGKSKVKISYEASSEFSTIASYKTEILGVTSKANPYTSAVLSNEGVVTIKGTVTDARGYSTEKTVDIEVISYSRPRITPSEGSNTIICTRCNSDGKVDPGGVYLLVKIGRKYSKVVSDSQKNFCKISYQYKTDAQGEDEYSDSVELLAKTATSDYVTKTLGGIVSSNTTAYNIRIIAEDDVGESDVVTITVPTAFVTFHSPPGGHGFTLGGYHDPSKVDVFDCWFDAEFHGTVSGLFEQGEKDGWYWRKYADGIAECWRRVKNEARDISTAFGSMFYGNCDEVTFPFSFYSAPVVNATVESGTALSLLSWQGTDGNGTTTAIKPASYRVIRPTSITGASFTIAYHAIGRWKE